MKRREERENGENKNNEEIIFRSEKKYL